MVLVWLGQFTCLSNLSQVYSHSVWLLVFFSVWVFVYFGNEEMAGLLLLWYGMALIFPRRSRFICFTYFSPTISSIYSLHTQFICEWVCTWAHIPVNETWRQKLWTKLVRELVWLLCMYVCCIGSPIYRGWLTLEKGKNVKMERDYLFIF